MPQLVPLDEIEKGIIQILISKGIVEANLFDQFLNSIIQEHINTKNPSYVITTKETLFKHINDHIRAYFLEIKTLVILSNDSNMFYHGIVNTEEDFVAKDFGTTLDNVEIKFFNDLMTKLISDGHLSTHDIESLDFTPNWNSSKLLQILTKLQESGWLMRDDRNYWNIGLRSYLELRRFIEAVINQNEDAVGDEPTYGIKLTELPQLIIY